MTCINILRKESNVSNLVPREAVNGQVVDILSLPPSRLINGATEIANVLKSVVEQQKLFTPIGGKKYVNVEGWTTLGSLMGIIPREVDVTELEDGSYTAVVELYNTRTGQVVGRGSALCGREEKTWHSRPRYALRSMAVTRATGKAFRLSFSWIMSLAGYAATPAEEMIDSYQPAPAPPRKVEIYDEKNPAMKKRLLDYLVKDDRVPDELAEYISGCMNGKEITTNLIKTLIDEALIKG